MHLREDLALAARSASLISQPAENIAIVADMDKWDVRLISSQTQQFPYAGGQSSPVGMSQLVSSMLETVQAMNAGGIPAYEVGTANLIIHFSLLISEYLVLVFVVLGVQVTGNLPTIGNFGSIPA